MAVTPLSALIAPGEFEIRLARSGPSGPGLVVHLSDRTRLVRGLAIAPQRIGVHDAVTNFGTDGRFLIVRIDGSSCDYMANLTFEHARPGFLIRTTGHRRGCFGTLRTTEVAFHLWTPIDASTVEFD